MGIRLTSVNTPIGGASWEYTKKDEQIVPREILPNQKIKVFISSICGKEKYDKVRKKLRVAIEDTKLAVVYTFEEEGASTLTAGEHYKFALEDSDVCIFLIDNEDGVTPGVQVEIDIVQKYNIKALYYFCDETSKEKTALEQSLMGASYAKSTTVHTFEDLSQDGANALINDIISVYHYYCKGKISLNEIRENDTHSISIEGSEKISLPTIPKVILKNVDKSKEYILKFIAGGSYGVFDGVDNTSEIDDWGVQFLSVLFEGKSIREFNTGMFLDVLRKEQTDEYHQIVRMRWEAVQAHFLGDAARCIEVLESALKQAKDTSQPVWVVKDILIDLRNEIAMFDSMNNRFSESEAQKELTSSNEELYYPIMDRINESLHEKYVQGLFKKKIESPYTITLGNNLNPYGELLSSAYIVALYNGSLTHILLFYNKLQDFLFYLSSKYDNWNLRRDMYKLAIFLGKEKEIKGIQESYPEILNDLDSQDAATIMQFCDNHPMKYKRLNSRMLALGAVGYYLDEEKFTAYSNSIVDEIKEWLNEENPVLDVGSNVFKCLAGISLRLQQEKMVDICCLFMEKKYIRWYTDLFKFMSSNINLTKMEKSIAEKLVNQIIEVLDDEKECEQVKYAPQFLYIFRKQDQELTELLHEKVAEKMTNFYNNTYLLETTENNSDLIQFVRSYLKQIEKDNVEQGKNGAYYGHGTRSIATIRAILLNNDLLCEDELMDAIVSTIVDTLIKSKEGISIKLDAVSLLIYVAIKYPQHFRRNINTYQKLVEKQEAIGEAQQSLISANVDAISLKIGLQFLFILMDIDTYSSILGLMPHIKDDVATTIEVVRVIVEYLETDKSVILPNKIEAVVLQNALQWVHSDNLSVRWYAIRILFALLRNPEYEEIVNQQLLERVDLDNLYIKNLIIRHIYSETGIYDTTRKFIVKKCQNDPNFVVRMVCEEEKRKFEENHT